MRGTGGATNPEKREISKIPVLTDKGERRIPEKGEGVGPLESPISGLSPRSENGHFCFKFRHSTAERPLRMPSAGVILNDSGVWVWLCAANARQCHVSWKRLKYLPPKVKPLFLTKIHSAVETPNPPPCRLFSAGSHLRHQVALRPHD